MPLDYLPDDQFAELMARPPAQPEPPPSGPPGPDIPGIVREAGHRYGLPEGLYERLVQQEIRFNPNAVSPVGAKGLAQIMDETGRGLGLQNPFDPYENADAGARYLRQMLDRYNGDIPSALAAYNAGPGAVDRYGGPPPYEETQRYLAAILGNQGPPTTPLAIPPNYQGGPSYPPPAGPPVPPPQNWFDPYTGEAPLMGPPASDAWAQIAKAQQAALPAQPNPLFQIPPELELPRAVDTRRLPGPIFGPPIPTVAPSVRPPSAMAPFQTPFAPAGPNPLERMAQTIGQEEERRATFPSLTPLEQLTAPDVAWRGLATSLASPEARAAMQTQGLAGPERAWEAWTPPPLVKGAIEMANPVYLLGGTGLPYQGTAQFAAKAAMAGAKRLAPVARAGAEAIAPDVLRGLERMGAMRSFFAQNPSDAAQQFERLSSQYDDLTAQMEEVGNRFMSAQMQEDFYRTGADIGVIHPPSGPLKGLTDADLMEIAQREGRDPTQPDWFDRIDPRVVKDYRESIKGRTRQAKKDLQREASTQASILVNDYNALAQQRDQLQKDMDGLWAALQGEGPLANEPAPLTFAEQVAPPPKSVEQQGWMFQPGEARPQFGAIAKPAGTADILGAPQFPDEAARLRWEREQQIAAGQGEMFGAPGVPTPKEPWQMRQADFVSNPPQGMRFDPKERAEATVNSSGDVTIGPKFFDLSIDARRSVLTHEQAHTLESSFTTEDWQRVLDAAAQGDLGPVQPDGSIRGLNGQFKPSEIITEAYSLMLQGGTEDAFVRTEYPKLHALITDLAESKKTPLGVTSPQLQVPPPEAQVIPPEGPPQPAGALAVPERVAAGGGAPPPPVEPPTAAGAGAAGGVPPRALPPGGPRRVEGEVIDTGLARPGPAITPPPVDDYQRLVASLTPEERPVWDRIKSGMDASLRAFYDRNYPLAKLQKESGVPVHDLAQIVPGAQAAGEERIRLSALPFIKPVAKDTKYLEQYMVAMRGKDLRARNAQAILPGGLEDPDKAIAEIKKSLGPERFAGIETAAKGLWANQDTNVLQVLRDEGFLTKEAYAKIRKNNPHYIDFHRADFSITDAFERQMSRPEASVSSHFINKILEEGSQRKLDQPLARSLAQYIQTANLAGRNRAAQGIHDGLAAVDLNLARVLKEGETEKVGTEGVISYFKNGSKVRVAVPKIYADVAKGLEGEATNTLTNILRASTAPLRHGAVTFNPAFIVVNPMRDALSALYRERLIPLSPEYLRGMVAAITRNTDFTDAAEAGVLMSGIVESMRSTSAVGRAASQLGALSVRRPQDLLLAIPRSIQRLNEIGEQGTRIAVYHKLRGEGVGSLEAAVRARDVTVDFAKSGNVMRLVNQFIPFSNAGVQGAANTLRTMRANPKQAAGMAALFTTPTVMAWLWNQRYDSAAMIPDYEYANNWVIQYGEGTKQPDPKYPNAAPEKFPLYAKIPKGPIAGLLTAPAEMALRIAWKKDDRSVVEHVLNALGTGASALSPVGMDVSSLALPVAGTVTQALTNTDWFRGAPIVPQREETRPPELQYGAETSKVATSLGERFKVSPRLIDFGIRDYTAGAGATTVALADLVLGALGYNPQVPGEARRQALSPQEQLAKLPVVSRFMGARGTQEDRLGYDRLTALAEEGNRQFMANPEVRRLGMTMGTVSESMKKNGQDVQLTWEQRLALQETTNTLKRAAAEAVTSQDYYQKMSDTGKAEVLKRALTWAGGAARTTLADRPVPMAQLQHDAAEYPVALGLYLRYEAMPAKRGLDLAAAQEGSKISAFYDGVKSKANGSAGVAAQETIKAFGADAMQKRNRYQNAPDNLERKAFWKANQALLNRYFGGPSGAALAQRQAG